MYMGENEVDGLFDVIKETATKAAGFLVAPPAGKAAMVAHAVAKGTKTVAKQPLPPSLVASPLPPKSGPLPVAEQRAPATWGDLFEKVFKPHAVSAVKSTAPGEQPQAQNSGQSQNRDAAPIAVIPQAYSDLVVGPLGVPVSEPVVNYQQQPPPVVVQMPAAPQMPPWLLPVALGGAALLLVMRK